MNERDRFPERHPEPRDPERAAARHEGGGRSAGETMRGAFEGQRFRGEEGGGERGYRGWAGEDTPPGSVPGGSYGAGGGYSRGGYDRGNFDPAVQWQRRGRGQEARGSGGRPREWSGAQRGGGASDPWPRSGSATPRPGPRPEVREERGHAGGDWRQGYGGYGMSERSGMMSGEDMFGRDPYDDEPGTGYGFGGGGQQPESEGRTGSPDYGTEGGWGGGSAFGEGGAAGGSGGWREFDAGSTHEDRSGSYDEEGAAGRWGERGSPNRGTQGGGWRGEQHWEGGRSGSRNPHEPARGGELDWPYMEPWAVPGPYTGRGPENYERSQEAIRNDVCERLTRHGRLDASRIRVLVENGEVILEGQVESRSAKRMAEDTAESVTGVRDVQNRLRIHDRGRD